MSAAGRIDTRRSNHAACPVTGQAAWFDLRVSIRPAADTALGESEPQLPELAYAEADERPLRYGARFRNKEHGR